AFPVQDESFIDKSLERKMEMAQIISSLVLSLRKKEMIKVRQPLQRVMVPVLDPSVKEQILAVADLIKSEVNVKEIEMIDDASGILVKNIKPNFRTLGPKFGKDMKHVVSAVNKLEPADITAIERDGEINIEVNGKMTTLQLDDVEITSQDIEGWLVASNAGLTVALDVT
ncbi:DUF5915 domain-containing protein, partial [Mesonia sp.]